MAMQRLVSCIGVTLRHLVFVRGLYWSELCKLCIFYLCYLKLFECFRF